MSFTLKVNFTKGWPCPTIVDHVGNPASGQTVDEGMIAHLNSAGEWVRGVSNVNQTPHVLWNGAAQDGDHGHVFDSAKAYAQVGWGGIQGVSFINQIEVETSQYDTGTLPAFGDQLDAHTDGKLYVAVQADGTLIRASKVICAICVKGPHKMANGAGNVNVITITPDMSKRTSPSS